jgi:hypothetical protein
MLKTALALALLVTLPAAAQAKAFKLGDDSDDSIAWITIPDTWEPSTFDNGVEGTSPDKETYVAAEIVDGAGLDAAGKDEDAFFAKQKIKIKEETKKEKEIEMSGLHGYDVQWEATDADGPTHISLTMLKVADNKLLMLTYWGSEAGEKSNVADLQTISSSIKPIK